MFKKIIIKVYVWIVNYSRFYKYFKLYNLRSKVKIHFKMTPRFEQKTFITGLGSIKIGQQCSFGFKMGGFHSGGSIELQPRSKNSQIIIGDHVNTNNNVFISSSNKIIIGSYTLIGQYVTIMDYEAHGIHPDSRRMIGKLGTVIIGENVWIGNNVTILKNTIIGKNTIVAAGAVVMGDFPDNVIIGGVPAKIIKNL